MAKGLDLLFPIGIDQFPNGNILIVDYGNRLLKVLNNKGDLLKTVSEIEGAGYYSPYDARIYGDAIYVVDRGLYRILVLNHDFELIDIIEKSAKGKYFFNYPQHIDFDRSGHLFVMDTNSSSIKVINVQEKP